MSKLIKLVLLIFLTLAVIANLNWLHSPYLGVILGLAYLIIFGFLLGKIIFPSQEKSWQILMGTLLLACRYSLLGAMVYYFYQLDKLVVSILLALISIAILYFYFPKFQNFSFLLSAISSKIKATLYNLIKPHITSYNLLTLTYIILFAVAIITLFSAQTMNAIRSPWQVIPRAFFFVYFLATLNLFLIIKNSKLQTSYFILHTLVGLHFFLTTSVALIVYRLGYGFDPFIHQATELAIFKQGLILPKPFYYLGQYSLVVIISHLFQISTEWIDKLLLLILLSVFLPYVIFASLTKAFAWAKNQALILTLLFLILPFELFIATTPQALANLLAIIILFLSFLYLKDKPGLSLASAFLTKQAETSQGGQIPFWLLALLAITTVTIHALAGIPIIIYLCLILLIQQRSLIAKVATPILALFASVIIPFALYLNSLFSQHKISISWQGFNLISLPTFFNKQYNYFLDMAYLYKNFIQLFLVIIAILAVVAIIKRKLLPLFLPAIVTFAILIINAILLNFINVSSIIYYEQNDFSQRVWQLAFYFLLPIIIYGFYLTLEKIQTKPFVYKLAFFAMLSSWLLSSLYLSYPRFDDYDNSKFINVSQADFQAVNFIEQNAAGSPYVVLTNQMTSAAAVKTFGFNREYNGQYFYPIPTGGELYQYYEKVIYDKASKENIQQAMDFAGVKLAYFVLPKYWSHFDQISTQAQNSADQIFKVGDQIMIYKYSK